jgi:hypothetical protein
MIDKIQSWSRKRKYKDGEYFRIAPEVDTQGILPVELLKGPFKGIIYSYGEISIDEDLGAKGAQASFDVDIIRGPQNLIQDEEFSKIISQILLVILDKAVRLQAEKFYKENLADEQEIGEDYSEEPVPQRTVRSKNSSISKKRVPSGSKRKNTVRRSSKVRSKVQSDSDD